MRVHGATLPYGIENHPILIQERVCNVCRVSIMIQQKAKNEKHTKLYLLHILI